MKDNRSRGWVWGLVCLIMFALVVFPGCGSPEEEAEPLPPQEVTEPPADPQEEAEEEDPEPETEGPLDDIVLPINLHMISLDVFRFRPIHEAFTLLEFRCEDTGLHMKYECMGVEPIDGQDAHRFRIEGAYWEAVVETPAGPQTSPKDDDDGYWDFWVDTDYDIIRCEQNGNEMSVQRLEDVVAVSAFRRILERHITLEQEVHALRQVAAGNLPPEMITTEWEYSSLGQQSFGPTTVLVHRLASERERQSGAIARRVSEWVELDGVSLLTREMGHPAIPTEDPDLAFVVLEIQIR